MELQIQMFLVGRGFWNFQRGREKTYPEPPQWGEYVYFLEKYNLTSSFKIQIVRHLLLSG